RTVQPAQRAAVDEKPPEVTAILQGLEHRAVQPVPKIDSGLGAVAEHQVNPKLTAVLPSDDGWKGRHEVTSFEGRNPVEWLAGLHVCLVGFEFGSVQYRPLTNQPQCSLRPNVAGAHLPAEIECRILALILGVE